MWHILERIDEFSLDKEHRLQLGRDELKFLYEEMLDKPLNIDLAEGFEKGVDKNRDESMFVLNFWRNFAMFGKLLKFANIICSLNFDSSYNFTTQRQSYSNCWRFRRSTAFGRRQGLKEGCVSQCAVKLI